MWSTDAPRVFADWQATWSWRFACSWPMKSAHVAQSGPFAGEPDAVMPERCVLTQEGVLAKMRFDPVMRDAHGK